MKKLHQLGVVDNYDLECALKEICCQNNNQESPKKDCCYRKCDSCCDKTCIPLTQENVNTYDQQQIVTYFQWKQTLKTYETENGTKEYKNIAKVEITQELGDLIDEFEHDLERYARHSYNIRHQFQAYRKYKQCLTDKMCVIHIDFSENYVCKYGSGEIQSVHFGGSHKQATLHTGMLYTSKTCESFCSISDCTRHDPPAIWAHLNPILREVRKSHPHVQCINFWSDSPAT